jgi:hypothetical protein
MLHSLLGIALIGVGSISMVARVMARSTEFRRRPVPRPAASTDSSRHS